MHRQKNGRSGIYDSKDSTMREDEGIRKKKGTPINSCGFGLSQNNKRGVFLEPRELSSVPPSKLTEEERR
jgi:hypothetical protein